MDNFYCQKICGEDNFSIEEWNDVERSLELTNLSEKEKNDILFPSKCYKQCFNCISNVGERQIKTKNIIKKNE